MFLYAYGRIQWTTGGYSGGVNGLGGREALAGINAGDGVNHFTIPGSVLPDIINIAETSNVGVRGRWMFNIGRGMNAYNTSVSIQYVINQLPHYFHFNTHKTTQMYACTLG